MQTSPQSFCESPRRYTRDSSIGIERRKSLLHEPLLRSNNKTSTGSSDIGIANISTLDSLIANVYDESRQDFSRTSLATFDPKPLREFFSTKQPLIRIMIIKDESEEPIIDNVRLLDLHENLVNHARTMSMSVNQALAGDDTPTKTFESQSADFEKVLELRGRDLFCIAKPAGEVDIPVVLIRQHMCVICARYDMRAIIQSDRIIFVGQSPDDTFEDIRRHMQVFLHKSGKAPGPPSDGQQKIRESVMNHLSAHSPTHFMFNQDMSFDSVNLEGFPFEIRAYEGLLSTVIGAHRNECEIVYVESEPFFDILDSEPESHVSNYFGSYSDQARLLTLNQHQKLRRLKEKVTAILSRVKFTATMIRELLEDEQLPFLCLSDLNRELYKKYNSSHSRSEALQVVQAVRTGLHDRQDDIEFLLEHHLTECLQLEYEAATILRRMENAEQDILIRLNVSQTQLLISNTFISVIATCIALGGFIAGLFGMNLDNTETIQPVQDSFAIVTACTLGLIVSLAVFVILILQYSAILPSNIRLRQQEVNLQDARTSIDRKQI